MNPAKHQYEGHGELPGSVGRGTGTTCRQMRKKANEALARLNRKYENGDSCKALNPDGRQRNEEHDT